MAVEWTKHYAIPALEEIGNRMLNAARRRTHGVHECPADGSMHENSAVCACGPVRADGGERWIHRASQSA